MRKNKCFDEICEVFAKIRPQYEFGVYDDNGIKEIREIDFIDATIDQKTYIISEYLMKSSYIAKKSKESKECECCKECEDKR